MYNNKNYFDNKNYCNHSNFYYTDEETSHMDIENMNNIITFNNFTDHNENDKLILYFLDLVKHSNCKYFHPDILIQILFFLIDDMEIIREIYHDLLQNLI